jgi:hypothetical protein
MCFSILTEEGIIHKVNDSPTSKGFQISIIPFPSNPNSQKSICKALLLLTQMVFFQEI